MPSRRQSPPPIAAKPVLKPALVIASSVIVALLLLVVVLNIDTAGSARQENVTPQGVTELIDPPRPLTEQEAQQAVAGTGGVDSMNLPKETWIEVADESGQRLAQRYRFARVDPNPPGLGAGWIRMVQPRAQIFLSGNRVLTLEGDSGDTYVPNRGAMERGQLTGNVVIRMFDAGADGKVDLQSDEPAMLVHTGDASFDNFTGEVRCDGAIHASTPRLDFRGRGLQLRFNDQAGQVQSMIVDEYEPIRIVDVGSQGEAEERAQSTADRDKPKPAKKPKKDKIARDNASQNNGSHVKSATPEADEPLFYRLMLRGGVTITQGRRIISGDTLDLVFSMKSKGLDQTTARRNEQYGPAADHFGRFESMSLATLLTAMAFGSQDAASQSLAPPPSDTDTIVTGSGSLTMVPLADGDERPESVEDALLEMRGRPVQMDELDSHAECGILTYRTLPQTLQLLGTDAYPLILSSSELKASADSLWISQGNHSGRFEGNGWMILNPDDAAGLPGGVLASGPPPMPETAPAPGTTKPAGDEPVKELNITWEQGVDLEFEKEDDPNDRGMLKRAIFGGNVKVDGESFRLSAEQMGVGFAPRGGGAVEPQGDDPLASRNATIESIDANGNVSAEGLGEPGSMSCDHMTLKLVQVGKRSAPRELHATGEVKIVDPDQTLWSQKLDVTFRKPVEGEAAPPPDTRPETGGMARADVETLLAVGDVRVLLKDGTCAFGDKLVGSGVDESAELTGANVLIVSDNVTIEKGTKLVLRKKDGIGRFEGPGQLSVFDRALPIPNAAPATQPQAKIERPSIEGVIEVLVRWNDSATFDNNHNDGQGMVDFRGKVTAKTEQTPLELNLVSAESLALEFMKAKTPDDAEARPEQPAAASLPQRGDKRDIRKLTARGDANLENRAWEKEDRSDVPRIFAISGQHVEYDSAIGEALVVGDGKLVVQDLRAADAAVGQPQPAAPPPPGDAAIDAGVPFGSKGISRFRWTDKLHMTRQAGDTSNITMTGDVIVEHVAINRDISTINCQQLDVVAKSEGQADAAQGINFAGPAQLQNVSGIGSVYVRTRTRDLECEKFVYNLRTKVAEIFGKRGRSATLRTRGSAQIMRMQRGLWDMTRDSISITDGGGATGR